MLSIRNSQRYLPCMIIRLTAKLAKRLHIPLQQALPSHDNPYLDWTATLFSADRVQYIMLTNATSLYTVVFYAKGLTSDDKFLRQSQHVLREHLTAVGFGFSYQRFIEPGFMNAALSKNNNRSHTASMNDLVRHARAHLIEGGMSPVALSLWLNKIPMGALKYACSLEVFPKMQPQ